MAKKKKKPTRTVVKNPFTGRTQGIGGGKKSTNVKGKPTKEFKPKRTPVAPGTPRDLIAPEFRSEKQKSFQAARERLRAGGKDVNPADIRREELRTRQKQRGAETAQQLSELDVQSEAAQQEQPIQPLQPNVIEPGQPIEEESFFDRLGQTLKTGEFSDVSGFEREATPKELAQVGVAGLGVGAAAIGAGVVSAAGGVAAITPAVVTGVQRIAQSGANLLSKPFSMVNKEAMKTSAGFLSRHYVIEGGKSRIVWNSKTMDLVQRGLRRIIGNKTLVGLTALGIVGSIYGFAQNALFMRGQVSDDNTDNIGGLQFSMATSMRNGKYLGDYTEALEIAEFAENVSQQIDEQSDFLDQFDTVQAGKLNQKTSIFNIGQMKSQILKLMQKQQKDLEKEIKRLRKEAETLEKSSALRGRR